MRKKFPGGICRTVFYHCGHRKEGLFASKQLHMFFYKQPVRVSACSSAKFGCSHTEQHSKACFPAGRRLGMQQPTGLCWRVKTGWMILSPCSVCWIKVWIQMRITLTAARLAVVWLHRAASPFLPLSSLLFVSRSVDQPSHSSRCSHLHMILHPSESEPRDETAQSLARCGTTFSTLCVCQSKIWPCSVWGQVDI